jgi:hypothetical protein
MFERYTEKARRTIFFAKYEANQHGSSYIETEHLLLGLMREDKRWWTGLQQQVARRQIESRSGGAAKISAAVDLPLSNESKRVLAFAAEEADRLGHRHIGTEHLLLALLREKKTLAAVILRQQGLELKQLRKELGKPVHPALPAGQTQRIPQDRIQIHGSFWDADYIRDAVARCREYSWHWHKRSWTPRDVVVYREDGSVSFDVSLVEDPAHFDLAKAGWKKDHCVVCRWELFESQDEPEHGIGYTNGREWLCTECHENFIANPNFFSSPYPEIT